LHGLRRKLAWLSHRNKSCPETIGHRAAEDEPAALDADDQVHPITLERLRHRVHHVVEPVAVAEQRGDVVEQDARLRKVRYVANLGLERFHRGVVSFELKCRYHGRMRNSSRRPVAGARSTSTSSTREPAGPCRIARSKRSTASASPSTMISTPPSSRLRTL